MIYYLMVKRDYMRGRVYYWGWLLVLGGDWWGWCIGDCVVVVGVV
jgi:hypothetical protein